MITLYAYRSSELSTYYAVMLCFICLINALFEQNCANERYAEALSELTVVTNRLIFLRSLRAFNNFHAQFSPSPPTNLQILCSQFSE